MDQTSEYFPPEPFLPDLAMGVLVCEERQGPSLPSVDCICDVDALKYTSGGEITEIKVGIFLQKNKSEINIL